MTIEEFGIITKGVFLKKTGPKENIRSFITDNRKPFLAKESIFCAIKGKNHDGHDVIKKIYNKGVRHFLVDNKFKLDEPFNNCNILLVKNTILSMQEIVRYHREQFDLPIIGITGSNGKTILKEWLYWCLSPFLNIIKSPHSYNSQIGVPLSVWNISKNHDLGIFEAGISKKSEMKNLEKIIQPSIGILTNIGSAHDEGFNNKQEKLNEKILLFKNCDIIIYNGDEYDLDINCKKLRWGKKSTNEIKILYQKYIEEHMEICLMYKNEENYLILPFNDHASVENMMHCIAFMLLKNYKSKTIQSAINGLKKLPMRMEIKQGANNSIIIDDTYTNDVLALQQALDFLSQQKHRTHKVLILSDLYESGMKPTILYKKVGDIIQNSKVDTVIGIGEKIGQHILERNDFSFVSYSSAEEFLTKLDMDFFSNKLILIKGARSFKFEKIVKKLEQNTQFTTLEINLESLTDNLNFYRSKLESNVKMMVMVKAFGYGNGSFEIANLLQFHKIDYLGVAYTDEGIHLRNNGVHLPIMVMNTNKSCFDNLQKYKLEPVIFHIAILKDLLKYVGNDSINIHLEIDTGMKRLGFDSTETKPLIEILKNNKNLKIVSIFSHMASSEHEKHDNFSFQQAELFMSIVNKIKNHLSINPIIHFVNSNGIIRFPQFHFDMVRLGIGLYGIAPASIKKNLKNVSVLKTVISQIKKIKKRESIGYGRTEIAIKNMEIATIAVGYADGYSRILGNNIGQVWIKNKKCKVIGNICMDMTMIDVTGLNVKVGDCVELFGKNITIEELAIKTKTIPYEILTNINYRVKRIYHNQ